MDKPASMNLIVAVNKNYVSPCKTMLFSFFQNHKNRKINVYILNSVLDESDLLRLSDIIHNMGGNATVIPVPELMFKDMPTVANRFSIEIYFRIFAHKFLPTEVDRALWLDSDLVLLKNIEDFYYQEFVDKSLVVCRDIGYQTQEVDDIKKRMNIDKDHQYFNSGVILFNIKLIRSQFLDESFYKIMQRYADKLTYPDQDLLNHIYQGKVIYADEIKFNFQVQNTVNVDAEKMGIRIMHYAGQKKPWDVKQARPIAKYYWKYKFRMKEYIEYFEFYFIYYLLWIHKYIKRIYNPTY